LQHSISVTERSEQALRRISEEGGKDVDQVLTSMAETLLGGEMQGVVVGYEGGILKIHGDDQATLPIRSNADLMGGDACIRNTRIPVWLVVRCKQLGFSDERILANYPGLTAADLIAAWDFYAANAERVESERRSHEEAA